MNSHTPNNNERYPRWKEDIYSPSFWISTLTLIALTIYTVFTHFQVDESRTANSIAKKALVEVNKPYVLATNINPNFSKDANGVHLRVGWTLTNLGNTPANHVRFTNCDPIIRDSATHVINCTVTEDKSVDLILGPKQGTTVAGSIIDPIKLKGTSSGQSFIYILGYITYTDSVDLDKKGDPEERITRFCTQLEQADVGPAPSGALTAAVTQEPQGQMQQPAAPQPLLIVGLGCPSYTCIDDACSKTP